MDTLTGKPSDLSPTPLLIFQSELALIEAETLRWPDRETGGELFGYFTYAGWPVVHRVVNANGSARRGSATFHPDATQIDAQGRDLIDNYGLQHLGQWHSHHRFSLTHPSGVDRSTVADAIRKYRLRSFVQVIANVRPKGRKEGAIAHAYFYGAQAADQCDTMRWLVLPGTSPVSALSGMDVALTSAIQLEPSVVAWDELRGQTPVESAKAPISDPTFLQRLHEELQALHAAGFVARGRPDGRCLRIDALRGGVRYSALLAPEYPTVPPELCRAADEGAPVAIEAAWAPDRRLVDVFAGSDTPLSSPKRLSRKQVIARTLALIDQKRRQFAAAMSVRPRVRRTGV